MIDERAGSFAGAHVYATGGIYDIVVNLSDDDSGTTEKLATALVTGARVKDGELQIVGTHGNDRVDINQFGKRLYRVHADFLPGRCHLATFDAADVESIKVLLGDGNDHATIADNIDLLVLMDGGAGNDHLNAGRGPAMLLGGDGNDVLVGGPSNDILIGGDGNDVIFGGMGNDLLDGGNDNDLLFGGPGNDTLKGGPGHDVLIGGNGDDTLDGGPGNDRLFGGRGNDKIFGGEGNDLLVGGSGRDTLDGGGGHDRLIDWHGNYGDSFVVRHRVGGVNHQSSPPWVRQFVVDLGADDRDPNRDIRVLLPGQVNEHSSGSGVGRRKVSVG